MAHGFQHHGACALYLYLAIAQPTSMAVISNCIVIDQFGYGFGFTAYMLFMIYSRKGKVKPRTTPYARVLWP